MAVTGNSFACKIIANVAARDVRKNWGGIGVLAVAQVDGLPKLLTSKGFQMQRTLVFD